MTHRLHRTQPVAGHAYTMPVVRELPVPAGRLRRCSRSLVISAPRR